MANGSSEHAEIYRELGMVKQDVTILKTELPYIKDGIVDLKETIEAQDGKQDQRWILVIRMIAGAGITLMFTVLGLILKAVFDS